MANSVVVVMAKAPVAGDVKTRLGATIGNDWSARFHAAFIADVCSAISRSGTKGVLAFAGDREHPGFDPPKRLNFDLIPQPSGDLGARLTSVAKDAFREHESVIIIGSDSPTLLPSTFTRTVAALSDSDVVIGPSFDGGYYLIGLNRARFLGEQGTNLSVFDQISWSTEHVFGETLRACHASEHRCQVLDFWYDVDTEQDLELMRSHLENHLSMVDPELAPETRALLSEFARKRG